MLKQLIQLFAEKFLVSKKSWVSNQAQASTTGEITITWTGKGEQDYTATQDGVVCVYTHGSTWTKLFSVSKPDRAMLLHNGGDYKNIFLPAAKGEKIRINLSSTSTNENLIKFIPTIGS